MVFSSNVFLLYFMPIFFAVYFLTPRKIRNYVLLFASLLFYAYGAPEFIIHLILSTVANFYLVRWMMKAKEKENGKTVLYSTHYMEEAQYLCDHIFMIYKGKRIAYGTPAELMEKTGTDNLRDTFKKLIEEEGGSDE